MESQDAYAQTSALGDGGSCVISAICRDGIILAAASRATIFNPTDPSHTPLAYYDACQKIFPIGAAAIAETGQGRIDNVFFAALIEDFSHRITQYPRIDNLLPLFLDYCRKSMPPAVFLEMRKQKLFAAGYDGTSPVVSYFNEQQPTGSFGYVTAGLLSSGKVSLSERVHDLQNLSVQEATHLSQKAIHAYAAEGERWKTIGGPTDILCLTPSGNQWIEKNTPDQKYTYTKELVTAYQQGKLRLTLIPPTTQEQLEAFFSTVA